MANLIAWVSVGPVEGSRVACAATPLIAEVEEKMPAGEATQKLRARLVYARSQAEAAEREGDAARCEALVRQLAARAGEIEAVVDKPTADRVRAEAASQTSSFQTFSLGVQARLGGGGQRVFGYGLIRLGAAFEAAIRHYSYGTEREHATLLLATTGGGVQGLVTRRLMLGGEASADYLFFLGEADPDNERPSLPALKVRIRLFIGVMF